MSVDLQDPRRGHAGRVRLHRDVLKSKAQAHDKRDAVARRARKVAECENRGCLENTGLFSLAKFNPEEYLLPPAQLSHTHKSRIILRHLGSEADVAELECLVYDRGYIGA